MCHHGQLCGPGDRTRVFMYVRQQSPSLAMLLVQVSRIFKNLSGTCEKLGQGFKKPEGTIKP